jgi:hypothetical protein
MRFLPGLIFGAALTIGGTYVYDSHNVVAAENGTAPPQRALVNWDVVAVKWQALAERAREEWTRHVAER